MMSMNGFTLSFFFPKQDFVRPTKDTAQTDTKDAKTKTTVVSAASDDADDRGASFSLYAYRFF